jgi:hypothetical protein
VRRWTWEIGCAASDWANMRPPFARMRLALADRILVIREGRLVRELVGHSASSFDVLKSALGEDENLDDDATGTA